MPLLDSELDWLKQQLEGLPKYRGTVECRFRGCRNDGVYFLRRRLKRGVIQVGYWCDHHEEVFGNDNMRRMWRSNKITTRLPSQTP